MRRIPRFPANYADADQARRRRLPAKWLAAMLITAAVALLAPGVTYVTACRSSTATAATATTATSSAGTRSTGTSASPRRRWARIGWRSTTSPSARTRRAAPTRRRPRPDWRQPPYPRPESVLTGNYYSCFPGRADLVGTNPDNWLLQGIVVPRREAHRRRRCRVREGEPVGTHSPADGGPVPFPRGVRHTKQHEFSDAVYYTTPSGAGVFSSGTQGCGCGLDPACIDSPRQPARQRRR